ncbi:Ubiquitin-like domain-containing protein CIP73 [Cardamine amara subsp. amara]|uniref:Ubiquitin-like domain-containing protein CIP73 n=1 Tax=Cardamine amara subsp. amara TaxID=228776 RepID=A0ABD1B0W7_CARAN
MEHNGKDEIMIHEIEASQAMVEIKIKTLDSQTYSLRVDKCVPVPTLKEQIASVTGVVTEEQRLICRGKVMMDDQLLSAYHVEDGHTLHLVVRQPIPPLSESSTSNAAADPALSAGDSQGTQRSRVVVGSFNIAEQADVYSDLSQIVSAVLGSLGISSTDTGIEGVEAMGPSTARDSSGGRSVSPNAVDQTSTPLPSSQPAVIPDSLTTLSEYLNHLRQEFAANVSNANNLHGSENSMGNVQDSGSTTGDSWHPRLSHLAEVLQSTRQLLTGEVADCLSNLSRLLGGHVNVTDPATRSLCQSNMLQSGSLLENLGISLLEIGRATMMLRLGQTPEDAIINAGPPVFISPPGRTPFQANSSWMGTNIGGLHAGTANSNPLAGQSVPSVTPRNIEIRIRTGSWVPASGTNQREGSTPQQTPAQSVPSAPSSTTDSVPSTRGSSETPRNPVALVIPVVARYQQILSSGERISSTGFDGVHPHVTVSSTQPQSVGTPGREGDSSSIPGARGFSELRNRIHQFLRPSSRREPAQAGSSEPQVAANPSATTSAETNEAVANAQVAPATTTDDGNFVSSILQQIMPFIAQNVASSSSDEAAGRGSNNSRQASSREMQEEQGSERGESSRRREPPSPADSKRQKRQRE